MDILQNIVRQTKKDVNDRKKAVAITDFTSFSGYDKKRNSLYQALNKNDRVSIIAEIKKASPSKGVIRDSFDPVSIASGYKANGASAISVLTDEPFFQGNLSYMEHVSKNSTIPVLRKDFIVDPYQIEEA
ncbi:indole-3-glycerol-phosphate synthase, partial [Balneolaceae bacterium ANBcel3]|nr:indole-3-glycerol-phosphate synthase [Balneolaceae bacterium ANBcel3]